MSISPFVSKKQYNDDFNKIKSNIEKIQKIDETSQSIEEGFKEIHKLVDNGKNLYDQIKHDTDQFTENVKSLIEQVKEQNRELANDYAGMFQRFKEDVVRTTQNNIDAVKQDAVSQVAENKRSLIDDMQDYKTSLHEDNVRFKNEVNDKLQLSGTDIKATCEKRIDDFINQQDALWSEKVDSSYDHLLSVAEDIKFEINKLIERQRNDIVKDAISLILESFNSALAEMGIERKNEITDAIFSMINPRLQINTEIEKPIPFLRDDEYFHTSYARVKACVKSGVIPMIVGPAGTGKSHAAEQLARDLGIRFYTANRVQNTFELTGFVNAAGKYVPTPFYRAFTEGGLFFFDEVDASSPEALVTINTATAQGYMAFPGRTGNVMAHPDFKVVCAGNTYGTGSTSEYTGRNKLDAATLDRFMVIDWGYDEGLEKQLVDNDRLLDICWKLRRVCEKLNLKVIVSTRGIKSLSCLLKYDDKGVFDWDELIFQKFLRPLSTKDLKLISSALKDYCDYDLNRFIEFIEKRI